MICISGQSIVIWNFISTSDRYSFDGAYAHLLYRFPLKNGF